MHRQAALALLAAAAALRAQADDPARRGLDPDPPRPALGLEGQFTTEAARLAPAGSWWMGLELDYVHGLLALKSGDQRTGWAVSDRVAGHLMGSRSFGRLELGAGLPVALWQRSDLSPISAPGVGGRLAEPVPASALGDLRQELANAIGDAVHRALESRNLK